MGDKFSSKMKLELITFLLFLMFSSCIVKEKRYGKPELNVPSTSVSSSENTYLKNKGSLKDTTEIMLKKLPFKLMDIRYDSSDRDLRKLVLLESNRIIHVLYLPSQRDYDGFSINWIKEINNGFEISIELGKNYFERDFQFVFRHGKFYLTKIVTFAVDYNHNNDEIKNITKIKPPLPFDQFDIKNYVQ